MVVGGIVACVLVVALIVILAVGFTTCWRFNYKQICTQSTDWTAVTQTNYPSEWKTLDSGAMGSKDDKNYNIDMSGKSGIFAVADGVTKDGAGWIRISGKDGGWFCPANHLYRNVTDGTKGEWCDSQTPDTCNNIKCKSKCAGACALLINS